MFAASASPHIDAYASASQDYGNSQVSDLANRRDQVSPGRKIRVNAYLPVRGAVSPPTAGLGTFGRCRSHRQFVSLSRYIFRAEVTFTGKVDPTRPTLLLTSYQSKTMNPNRGDLNRECRVAAMHGKAVAGDRLRH
jgi:hypothetical protein